MFHYDGVTTNNNSKAYNKELGAKLNHHPNVYLLLFVEGTEGVSTLHHKVPTRLNYPTIIYCLGATHTEPFRVQNYKNIFTEIYFR